MIRGKYEAKVILVHVIKACKGKGHPVTCLSMHREEEEV
jgi:hypothetical protein